MSNRNKYEYLKQLDGTYKCPRCGKTFNKYGIGPHIWRAHSDDGKDFKPYLDKIPWNKNLTKETDIRIKQIADKIGNNHWLGRMHKDESKIKISNGRKKWFEDGGVNSNAGRCNKYHYESPIAGEMSLDGTWELRTAIFFDGSELTWKRNTKGFKYIHPETNKSSIYIPDFYVDDWNTYIEVKGYISKVDHIKWEQFSEPLEVWDESVLQEYGILS